MVRKDLNHPDWDGLPLLPEASPRKPMDRVLEFEGPIEDLEGVVITPPKKDALPLVLEENPDGEIQETLEHREVQPVGDQQPLVVKTPADMLGPPNGPLRVVSSSRKSGPGGTFKIHLLTTENKGVGCGWQPSINKAQDLNLSRVVIKSVPGAFGSLVSLQTGQWTPNQRKKTPSCHHLRQIA